MKQNEFDLELFCKEIFDVQVKMIMDVEQKIADDMMKHIKRAKKKKDNSDLSIDYI